MQPWENPGDGWYHIERWGEHPQQTADGKKYVPVSYTHLDVYKRQITKEGVKEDNAEAVLKKQDKRRKSFYDSHTNWEWGNPKYFSICLDSGVLGLDLCTSMLVCTVKEAAQLKIW